MNKIPKDVLIDLALDLSLPDLLSLCRSSSTSFICYSDVFWAKKLKKDYGLVGVKNPKQAYKNIPGFRSHCKNLVLKRTVESYNIVLENINSDYFTEFYDYLVFKYLLSKILGKGKGLENYYIVEYNKVYKNPRYGEYLSKDSELTYDEYRVFIHLLNSIKQKANTFERGYIDGMIRGDIPFDVNWGKLCNYNIY